MTYYSRLPLAMLWVVLAASACTSENASSSEPCAEDILENSVKASNWAQQISPVETYHYKAHLADGRADIKLLDSDQNSLGTMTVSQRYGHPDIVDGSMEAILTRDDSTPLRLVTRGHEINATGYHVHMELIDDKRSMHIVAGFQYDACAQPDPTIAAPDCASSLPIIQNAYTLPSCGLIADEQLLAGKPPTLHSLTYEVEASTPTPSLGGASNNANSKRWSLQVLDQKNLRPTTDVEKWLQEVGHDDLIGSDRERILTTAYLDRAWWRAIEQQIAFCATMPDDENLNSSTQPLTPDINSKDLATRRQAACPGQQNNNDWGGKSNNGSGANAWGDPHITTFDHHAYDFQGAGEYILVESTISDNPMLVQARMEPGLGNPIVPTCADVTYVTAIATEITGHKIQLEVRPDWTLTIDGKAITDLASLPPLKDGANIRFSDQQLTLQWPDGSILEAIAKGGKSLTINMNLSQDRQGQVQGLLGNFNANPDDDRALPDKTVLTKPISFKTTYDVFGAAWLVTKDASLFTYPSGKTTLDYQIANFPGGPALIDDIPLEMRQKAEQTCKSGNVNDPERLNNCILDTVCAADDDLDFAEDAATAPDPLSIDAPNGELTITGDLRKTPTPPVVEPQDETGNSSKDTCIKPILRTASLISEIKTLALTSDLDTDAADPGIYSAQTDLQSPQIPAGTDVRSYLLFRDDAPPMTQPLVASVRFSVPILGVILQTPDNTDALLGAKDSTYTTSSFKPFLKENNTIEISEDQHEIKIIWTENEASRFRVITAIPTEGN